MTVPNPSCPTLWAHPPTPQEGPPIRWGCGDIGFGLGLMFVLSLVLLLPVVAVMTVQGPVDTNAPPIILAGLAATWIGLGGWSIVASRWRGLGSLRDDFHFYFKLPHDIGLGLAGGAVAILAGVAVAATERALGIDAISNGEFLPAARNSNIAMFVVLGLATSIGAPVVEELFFRGLSFTAIHRRLGAGWAVALTTVLFGMLHYQTAPGWSAAFLVVHITTFGLVLGLLRARTHRCGASVVAHMTINTFGVLLVLFGVG